MKKQFFTVHIPFKKRGFPVSLYNISNKIGKYITKETGFGPGYAIMAKEIQTKNKPYLRCIIGV